MKSLYFVSINQKFQLFIIRHEKNPGSTHSHHLIRNFPYLLQIK